MAMSQPISPDSVTWTISCIIANLGICMLGLWKCFANNYLHWASTCTWLLLNLQGKSLFPLKSLSFTIIKFEQSLHMGNQTNVVVGVQLTKYVAFIGKYYPKTNLYRIILIFCTEYSSSFDEQPR